MNININCNDTDLELRTGTTSRLFVEESHGLLRKMDVIINNI